MVKKYGIQKTWNCVHVVHVRPPRAFRPSFLDRVRTTTTTQEPPIQRENEVQEVKEEVEVQPQRIPFGGRVSLFSSPRQRFRPRPRIQQNENEDTTTTTARPTGGRTLSTLLRRRPNFNSIR